MMATYSENHNHHIFRTFGHIILPPHVRSSARSSCTTSNDKASLLSWSGWMCPGWQIWFWQTTKTWKQMMIRLMSCQFYSFFCIYFEPACNDTQWLVMQCVYLHLVHFSGLGKESNRKHTDWVWIQQHRSGSESTVYIDSSAEIAMLEQSRTSEWRGSWLEI